MSMGVYIKGMEMPQDYAVVVKIFPDGRVGTIPYIQFFKVDLIEGAQAVPVPPHGRLKDADAVERNLLKMQQAQTGPCSHGVRKSRAVLRDAPTIIPAELPVHHGTFAATSEQEALKRIAPAEEGEA